ncbi:MAG: RluA family pseudouridine synthase [Gammaproteobacteria bacterium]|nr:RluA family pseudouridine synthase [Gammaproteobacteria bacterium]
MSDTKRAKVRLVEVHEKDDGQRIDNYLLRELKGVPRSHIYRLLRTGQVRVNKSRIKASHRLAAGDVVRVPPLRLSDRDKPARVPDAMKDRLETSVVYEDDALLAINKPAGMAAHGGSGISFGVIETLRQNRPNAPMLELVHRLDRDTSGLLLIAKRRAELRDLHELLRAGKVEKRYLALVKGKWSRRRSRVTAKLRKNIFRGGERMVSVDESGRDAVSDFYPLAQYQDATLVEVRIHTGRTHQIRVHAAHAGHPILGDDKYGDPAANRAFRALGLKRLFLHSHFLGFNRAGAAGGELELSAPLDDELTAVLDTLEARK